MGQANPGSFGHKISFVENKSHKNPKEGIKISHTKLEDISSTSSSAPTWKRLPTNISLSLLIRGTFSFAVSPLIVPRLWLYLPYSIIVVINHILFFFILKIKLTLRFCIKLTLINVFIYIYFSNHFFLEFNSEVNYCI